MARSKVAWDGDALVSKVEGFDLRVNRAMFAAVELHASRSEESARANAPWTDRTGNARSGLRAKPFHAPNRHGFDLFHSVPYGIWLEVRWSGRYAIIEPTIRHQGVEAMRTVAALLRRG